MIEEKEKESKQIPAAELSITIGNNVYVMKRPNIGQIIDMERMKLKMTGGTHNQMLFSSSQSQEAYIFTDMVAVFTVLLGDKLQTDLRVASLLELTPDQAKDLVAAYENKVFPWLQQLKDLSKKD
jgi:hypothetical protein